MTPWLPGLAGPALAAPRLGGWRGWRLLAEEGTQAAGLRSTSAVSKGGEQVWARGIFTRVRRAEPLHEALRGWGFVSSSV